MKMTRAGIYYLVMVVVITVAATNTKINILHLFNAFLIAMLFVSWGLARVNGGNFSVRMESPPEIFSGEPFSLRYLIANTSCYSKFALRFSDPLSSQTFDLVNIPARNTAGVCCKTVLRHRGRRRWKHVEVESDFPFGFMQKKLHIPLQHEILVLPKPRRYTSLALPTKASMFRDGNFTAMTRTASQDFASLRDYQAGDNWRSIHWKATARSDELVVKEYEEDLPAGVSIVFDTWAENHAPAAIENWFETGISVTASLVWDIAHAGYLILYAHGRHLISYGRGEEHALRIMRTLAGADVGEDTRERTAVETALKQIPGSSTAIFVFFRLREEIERYLMQLSQMDCQVIGISLDAETATSRPWAEIYSFQGFDGEDIVLRRS